VVKEYLTAPPQPPSDPTTFRISISHPLPSLNAVLGLGHWKRGKLKQAIQDSTLSALRACESASLIPTTWFQSGTSIPSATLASYQTMRLNERALKRANAKHEKAKKNTRKSR
jgi:hypothetical protein